MLGVLLFSHDGAAAFAALWFVTGSAGGIAITTALFSFPVEAGFCPYIAGPVLSASDIVRALLLALYPPDCVEG